MEPIIEVKHLKKFFGQIQAVKDISFYVEPSTLFAFLGPNGAGKSTTINTLCTFLKPDEGSVIINGYTLGTDDDNIRESIGVVFQENLLDDLLTVKENLMLRGSFYGMSKTELKASIENASHITQIENFLDRPYGKLSGGQRRRVDIARALIHTPKILFLDEPTTGLDPQTRKNVWDTIKRLQSEQGMTVFLTTHYMEEAEDSDYCVIVDNGGVIAKGTPFQLKEEYAKDILQMKCSEEDNTLAFLNETGYHYIKKADFIEVSLPHTLDALPILDMVRDHLISFSVIKGSMDDVFLNITGREIRE